MEQHVMICASMVTLYGVTGDSTYNQTGWFSTAEQADAKSQTPTRRVADTLCTTSGTADQPESAETLQHVSCINDSSRDNDARAETGDINRNTSQPVHNNNSTGIGRENIGRTNDTGALCWDYFGLDRQAQRNCTSLEQRLQYHANPMYATINSRYRALWIT
jgi:hypothetical protein